MSLARSTFAILLVLAIAQACSSELSGYEATDGGEVDDSFPLPDAAPVADAAIEPEACQDVAPACPRGDGVVEGAGLVEIDRCAFPLEARNQRPDYEAMLDLLAEELEVVDLAGVVGDFNRSATRRSAAAVPGNPPGVRQAFAWDSVDQAVSFWRPQGIASSGNAVDGGAVAGRKLILSSWYYEKANDPSSTQQKGVRVAIADVTDPDQVQYRFVLLVEPAKIDGRVSFKPVNLHAGGLAWFGRYLYVVDFRRGFRVFDLDRMMKVSTGLDLAGYDAETDSYHAYGYGYVLPQVEMIASVSTCDPRFSFVSLDRSTDPPSLLSGEHSSTSVAGRLYRWPLDGDTGWPALTASGRLIADEVFFAGHSHLQGAVSDGGTYWLSSSKPGGGGGVLHRTAPATPTSDLPWSDGPEDLGYDPGDDGIWSVSGPIDARHVFRVDLAAVSE